MTLPSTSSYIGDVAAVASTGRVLVSTWFDNTIRVYDTNGLAQAAASTPTPGPWGSCGDR